MCVCVCAGFSIHEWLCACMIVNDMLAGWGTGCLGMACVCVCVCLRMYVQAWQAEELGV